MLAAYVEEFDPDDPASALTVGERPEPEHPHDWALVDVRAAALNRHDVFALQGVALEDGQLPMILGCDAAGVDETGREVVVHAVVSSPGFSGDELLDPGAGLLSEHHPGTFAERLRVPRHNLVDKPASMSFEEAACLPTAWLTAYRMLFVQAGLVPGSTMLVQGATGGLSTALVMLARAAGVEVHVTSRSEEGRQLALRLGASSAHEPGARLPDRVDAVMDSVGGDSWTHSLRSLRTGGAMVVAGGTAAYHASVEVNQVFARQLRILGSRMGTRAELERLVRFCTDTGIRPLIDRVVPLEQAPEAMAALVDGGIEGKIVLRVGS